MCVCVSFNTNIEYSRGKLFLFKLFISVWLLVYDAQDKLHIFVIHMLNAKVCVKSFRVRNIIYEEDETTRTIPCVSAHEGNYVTSIPVASSIKQPFKGRATYRAAH